MPKALTSMLRLLFKPINACNDKCTFLIWCENLLGSFKYSPCNRSNQNTKIILIREKKQNQSRSSHGKCSVKNVLSEISQNSQENTCAKVSFLIKLLAAPVLFLPKVSLRPYEKNLTEFKICSSFSFFYQGLVTMMITSSVLPCAHPKHIPVQ